MPLKPDECCMCFFVYLYFIYLYVTLLQKMFNNTCE